MLKLHRQRASADALGQTQDEALTGMLEMDMFNALEQLSHWKFVSPTSLATSCVRRMIGCSGVVPQVAGANFLVRRVGSHSRDLSERDIGLTLE